MNIEGKMTLVFCVMLMNLINTLLTRSSTVSAVHRAPYFASALPNYQHINFDNN